MLILDSDLSVCLDLFTDLTIIKLVRLLLLKLVDLKWKHQGVISPGQVHAFDCSHFEGISLTWLDNNSDNNEY